MLFLDVSWVNLLQRTNDQKTEWGTEMPSEKEGLQQCEHSPLF
jgi:hypothetical protein